jgi:signal transduction histidine kinase
MFRRIENLQRFRILVLLGIAYAISAYLTHLLSFPYDAGPPVWPATGVALSAIAVSGPWLTPFLFVGEFALTLVWHHDFRISFFLAMGNLAQALVWYVLYKKWTETRSPFEHVREYFLFVAAIFISTAFSALVGSLCSAFYEGGGPIFNSMTIIWWLQNAVAAMILVPFVIQNSGLGSVSSTSKWRKFRQSFLSLSVLTAVSAFVFVGWTKNYALEYLPLPFLIWIALRFGVFGTSLGLSILAVISAFGTVRGLGPFARPDINESIFLIQAFLISTSLFSFCLVAIIKNRERVEQSLTQSNGELERFAYLASHDLQEPLRTVTSFCRLIERKYGSRLPPEGQEYVTLITAASQRMNLLIGSVLDYIKIGLNLKPEVIDSREALQSALDELATSQPTSKLEVTTGPLPKVYADSSILALLFRHLLSNSIKFSGPRTPVVKISAEAVGSHWRFEIADNGVGIALEEQPFVFRLFQRVTARGPGSAIGLATCKKIVEEHGGRIWLESQPGCGSRFFFTLPGSGPRIAQGKP